MPFSWPDNVSREVLPIDEYLENIYCLVIDNPVTIVQAETGAGKTTRVPQMLNLMGFKVAVTQPRRLAARTVAQRVAQEMGVRLGSSVGYRTAFEHCDSLQTTLGFYTDGLQLVREVTGHRKTGGQTILVLDEVHEWNLNIEVLIAWTKHRLDQGEDIKVVIMSATMDTDELATYYQTSAVIHVPGRMFPVEHTEIQSSNLIETAAVAVGAGKNILIFQPGKAEITMTIAGLQELPAQVLPLHGELEPAEQQKCFENYNQPKIVVATNVAQTSVTIPDIDVVIDSGMERRTEVSDDGVEGLYLRPISQADCLQRKGRAGRTKPGQYFRACGYPWDKIPDYPKPEILRSRLDQVVLRLAVEGFDAESLPFFHQPDKIAIHDAKQTLQLLGAMQPDGQVTPIGRRMAELPISVRYARMLIEAKEHGVIQQVATIAACLEAGDIRSKNKDNLTPKWYSHVRPGCKSDLLAQFDIYNAGLRVRAREDQTYADALKEVGIFAKNFRRAREIRNHLMQALKGLLGLQVKKAEVMQEQEAIVRSCVTGMIDHLFHGGARGYVNGSGSERKLSRDSVVGSPPWLVGVPFDLTVKDRFGFSFQLELVIMATAVEPAWLAGVAPHLIRVEYTEYKFDWIFEKVYCEEQVFFNDKLIASTRIQGTDNPKSVYAFAMALARQEVNLPDALENGKLLAMCHVLEHHLTKPAEDVADKLASWYAKRLGNVCSSGDARKLNLAMTLGDVEMLFPSQKNPGTVTDMAAALRQKFQSLH